MPKRKETLSKCWCYALIYVCIYKYIYYIYMVVMVLQSTLFEQISVPF